MSQQDFYQAYAAILKRKKQAILCGGTGMYLQAALSENSMLEVPENEALRHELNTLSDKELVTKLLSLKPEQHNTTDIRNRERTIRAIEIELFQQKNRASINRSPVKKHLIMGIKMEREQLRSAIEDRLRHRLKNGMLEEVQALLAKGLTHEQLNYYGLEYRFLSLYLHKVFSYEEMYNGLLRAIRRFAKKQMTWFRRMEKQGATIHWMDASLPMEEKVAVILNCMNEKF